MKSKNTSKKKPMKLVKITIREKSTRQIIIELLPTKNNIAKANNMAAMEDVEVIRVYE